MKTKYETFRKRPKDATPERALELHEQGKLSYAEIAKLWGISAPMVAKLVARVKARQKQEAGG